MTTWFNLMAVAGGGAAGSVCRYALALAAVWIPGGSSLLGTVVANVVGCAAIGAFISYVDLRALAGDTFPERARLAVQVGFLGGLTTFSSYVAEKNMLVQNGRWGLAGLYIVANLVIGWAVLVLAAQGVKSWMNVGS